MSTKLAPLLLGLLLLVPAAARAERPLFVPGTDGPALLPALAPELPSPADFLGYSLGERFTQHARILEYFRVLDTASDRVRLEEYGRTYEDRPLVLLTITSSGNQTKLEELRRNGLRLAGDGDTPPAVAEDLFETQPIVVWLAFGVHGNETSAAEVAMAVAYTLAAAQGELAIDLERVVVVIDPLVNPDGRERYVGWYTHLRGLRPDPDPNAAEHFEPWPGGRQNHYLVDLNRDWSWLTQTETRHRVAAYRRWEPQIYVDFHEMSADSSYFFPPPADPVHPEIAPSTLGWLEVFGRANAGVFDAQGWPYYMGEVYDLFYPGYGDTYPGLRGAVGMTYEMAGGGRAGSLLELPDGSRLALPDRITRHFTTALTTLRTAARHRRELLRDFVAGRANATGGIVHTYLWRRDQPESAALAELLEQHGVEVEALGAESLLHVAALTGGGEVERTLPPGSFAVATDQPLGRLVRALLEPGSPLPPQFLERQRRRLEANREAEIFDITAWSLPLAYGIETWRMIGKPAALRPLEPARPTLEGEGSAGFLIALQGLATYRLAAGLLADGIRVRLALEPFRVSGHDYPAGTLLVPRLGNPDDLETRLRTALGPTGLRAQRLASFSTETGPSLGSNAVVPLRPSRIGLLRGEGIDVTCYGSLWHLLDQKIELHPTQLELTQLDRIDLDRFDVLVMPDGDGYGRMLAGNAGEELARWVRRGGILITIGEAFDWLEHRELTQVKKWQKPSTADLDSLDPEIGVSNAIERRPLETPGAILATQLNPEHPIAVGLESPPPVLFVGSEVLMPTGDPKIDVLSVRGEDPVLAGLVWPEKKERLSGALLIAVEELGDGKLVVFAQQPAFRLFWRVTMPFFLNAVMFGPSLDRL